MAAKSAAVLAAAGVLAGCAAGEKHVVGYLGERALPPGLVWDVVFTGKPDKGALRGAYPARAQTLGLDGLGAAECEVGAQGQLSRCRTIDEKPEGYGFGAAAMSLASSVRVATRTASGRNLVGRRVRYRIAFEAGPRFSQVGFCERVKLELEGRTADFAARAAAAGELSSLEPLFAATPALAAERIEAASSIARVVVAEQPGSARRIADECGLFRPDREMDLNRAAPEAFSVWVDERGEPHLVERANWAVQPLSSDILRVYPPAARARRLRGDAWVQCRVSAAGALHACALVKETPQRQGFGAAAVRLVQTSARMIPEKIDGAHSDQGTVTVPVAFGVN